MLRQELRLRGVSDIDIESALDQIDEAGEREAALALAERKLRTLSRYDEASQRRRLLGMLMRRGYDSSVAYAVVTEVMRSEAAHDQTWA